MKRRNLLLSGPAMAVATIGAGLPTGVRAQSDTIRFGQSASLTGGQAQYGADVRDGILAAFAAAASAEPRGPRFELVALDDGGNKDKCIANVKRFIDDERVVSLLGLTSGAAAEASMAEIEKAKITLLGTASGNMGVRDPKYTMAVHVRAGYADEYKAMIRYIKEFGMTRVGYVHLADTSPANQAAMTTALDSVGLKITTVIPLDRNAKSFVPESTKLLDANLQCVMFTTNAAPILGIVDAMTAKQFSGFHFSSSFGGQVLFDEMAKRKQMLMISQVVPRPSAVARPVVKLYRDSLAAFGPDKKPGYTSLEGFIAGLAAVEAARAASRGGPVTRARFHESLTTLKMDKGGYALSYSPRDLGGSHFVDIVAVDRTGRLIG